MIEDIDKKPNNSIEAKNIPGTSSRSDKEKKDNLNNLNSQNINSNQNNNQQLPPENFGSANKDFKTNLSTNATNQYNTNSNFMRANN